MTEKQPTDQEIIEQVLIPLAALTVDLAGIARSTDIVDAVVRAHEALWQVRQVLATDKAAAAVQRNPILGDLLKKFESHADLIMRGQIRPPVAGEIAKREKLEAPAPIPAVGTSLPRVETGGFTYRRSE